MSIRLTQEEFISECMEVHSNKYDYSLVEFTLLKNKVTIVCPIHGAFEQIAGNHRKGFGCKKCGALSTKALTTEEYVARSKEKFGDRFDYSKVDYINEDCIVTLSCLEHGEFSARAANHLASKSGSCPACKRLYVERANYMPEDIVWEMIREKHGDRYKYLGYVGDEYKGLSNTYLRIVCERHGEFKQLLASHARVGHGCRFCGYDSLGTRTRESYVSDHEWSHLYLLNITNKCEQFLKVGISTDMKTRLRHLLADIPDASVEQVRVLKLPSGVAWDTEKRIHNSTFFKKYKPNQWFGGGTECYELSEIDLLTTAFDNLSEKLGGSA